MVTAAPDVRSMSRHARDELLVLACDGVWDVISSDDAVRFVRDRLRSAVAPAGAISGAHITSVVDAAGALVEHALDAGSRDNMTASVVLFNLTPEAANKLRAGGAGEATDASAGPGRASASRDRHDSAAQSSAPGSDTGSRRKALRTRGSGRNLHVVSGEEESLGSGMGIRVTPRPGSTRAGGPSSDVGSKRGGFFGGSPGGDATAAAAAQPVPSEPAGSEHSAAAEPPVSAVGGVAITAAADRRARHRHSRAGHATGRDAHGRRLYSGRSGSTRGSRQSRAGSPLPVSSPPPRSSPTSSPVDGSPSQPATSAEAGAGNPASESPSPGLDVRPEVAPDRRRNRHHHQGRHRGAQDDETPPNRRGSSMDLTAKRAGGSGGDGASRQSAWRALGVPPAARHGSSAGPATTASAGGAESDMGGGGGGGAAGSAASDPSAAAERYSSLPRASHPARPDDRAWPAPSPLTGLRGVPGPTPSSSHNAAAGSVSSDGGLPLPSAVGDAAVIVASGAQGPSPQMVHRAVSDPTSSALPDRQASGLDDASAGPTRPPAPLSPGGAVRNAARSRTAGEPTHLALGDGPSRPRPRLEQDTDLLSAANVIDPRFDALQVRPPPGSPAMAVASTPGSRDTAAARRGSDRLFRRLPLPHGAESESNRTETPSSKGEASRGQRHLHKRHGSHRHQSDRSSGAADGPGAAAGSGASGRDGASGSDFEIDTGVVQSEPRRRRDASRTRVAASGHHAPSLASRIPGADAAGRALAGARAARGARAGGQPPPRPAGGHGFDLDAAGSPDKAPSQPAAGQDLGMTSYFRATDRSIVTGDFDPFDESDADALRESQRALWGAAGLQPAGPAGAAAVQGEDSEAAAGGGGDRALGRAPIHRGSVPEGKGLRNRGRATDPSDEVGRSGSRYRGSDASAAGGGGGGGGGAAVGGIGGSGRAARVRSAKASLGRGGGGRRSRGGGRGQPIRRWGRRSLRRRGAVAGRRRRGRC